MVDNHNDPAATHAAPNPGVLIADHYNRAFGYTTRRPRGTRDWLITCTIGGEGRFRLNGRLFSCRSGDIVILKPGTPHDYEAAEGEGWEFVWAHFVPPPYWGRAVQLPEEENGLIFLALEDEALHRRILQAFERLILDARTWKGGEELAMNGLHEVFLLLSRKFAAREGPVLDERVERVLQRMTESLQEPHSVASLAEEVHLSASRLAHLFKEQMGDSLMETLLQLRLRHAAKLLAFTRRPVSEIAESVGFASPFYFTKQFRTFYGCPPTRYRREQSL